MLLLRFFWGGGDGGSAVVCGSGLLQNPIAVRLLRLSSGPRACCFRPHSKWSVTLLLLNQDTLEVADFSGKVRMRLCASAFAYALEW